MCSCTANNYFPQSFLADGCSCYHIKQICASSMLIRPFRNWCCVNIALMSARIIFSSNWAIKFCWKDVWQRNVRERQLWNMSSHPAKSLNVVQIGCIKVLPSATFAALTGQIHISHPESSVSTHLPGTHYMTEDGELQLYSLSSFQALLSIDGLPIKPFHTWMDMWGMYLYQRRYSWETEARSHASMETWNKHWVQDNQTSSWSRSFHCVCFWKWHLWSNCHYAWS